MRNIKKKRAQSETHYCKRGKSVCEARTCKQISAMDVWGGVEQPTSRSCLVKTAMGPVRRNHVQIWGARMEPAERKTIQMDQLEIASTHSEQEQERELQSTPAPANKCALRCSHTELESTAPQADKCGLRCSQRICKLPSRFKDYIM